jgi:hypothetical protein
MPRPLHEDTSEITVGDVLRRMRITQFWAVLGSICALLAGAFALGRYFADLETAKRTQFAEMSKRKQEFLIDSVRFFTAKEAYALDPTASTQQDLKLNKDLFVSLISKWWAAQESNDVKVTFLPDIVRESNDPTKSRIHFGDNSDFVIPPEIKREVLNNSTQH